jgi:predicted RNase H-like nuclease (RuvC/YqgF family)
MGEYVPLWVGRVEAILEWVTPSLWFEGTRIRREVRAGLGLEYLMDEMSKLRAEVTEAKNTAAEIKQKLEGAGKARKMSNRGAGKE